MGAFISGNRATKCVYLGMECPPSVMATKARKARKTPIKTPPNTTATFGFVGFLRILQITHVIKVVIAAIDTEQMHAAMKINLSIWGNWLSFHLLCSPLSVCTPRAKPRLPEGMLAILLPKRPPFVNELTVRAQVILHSKLHLNWPATDVPQHRLHSRDLEDECMTAI